MLLVFHFLKTKRGLIEMNDTQYFTKIIKEIKFAMLTTTDVKTGALHSRPMTLQEIEFDGDLWFFASKSSGLVQQIENSSDVNLAFSNMKNFSFVSAQGIAQVMVDKEKARELWNPLYRVWFTGGLEDPSLCLIRMSVESADYWESPESKLVRLAGFAKAILSGGKNNAVIGKHGHLNIS